MLQRKARQYVLVISIMLSISACAARFQKNIPDDFDVMQNPEYGVVVGSVSSIPDDGWQEMSQYRYHSFSAEKIDGVISSAAKHNPFTVFADVPKCEDEGLEAECGRLFAIALPAGDYEIYGVTVSLDQTKNKWEGRQLSGYEFSVKRGQVSYIGNLKSSVKVGYVGKSLRYRDVVTVDGMVADQFERDVSLLRARFPELESSNIERNLIIGDAWQWRRADKGNDQVTYQ